MGKLNDTPFHDCPRYSIAVSEDVQSWFSNRTSDWPERVLDALLLDQRLDSSARLLPAGDALRLIVLYRRADIWAAIVHADKHRGRRDWMLGAALEDLWNHDIDGFRWFAALPGGPEMLARLDLIMAVSQAQQFCATPLEFKERQEVLSLLLLNRPLLVKNHPQLWPYLVAPTISLMELCSRNRPFPTFEEQHLEHLRPGSFAHFRMVLAIQGSPNRELWREMRRFVEEGPAAAISEDKSYGNIWHDWGSQSHPGS